MAKTSNGAMAGESTNPAMDKTPALANETLITTSTNLDDLKPTELLSVVEEFHNFEEQPVLKGFYQGVGEWINPKTGEVVQVARILESQGVIKFARNHLILKSLSELPAGTPVAIKYLGKRNFKDINGVPKQVSLFNIVRLG